MPCIVVRRAESKDSKLHCSSYPCCTTSYIYLHDLWTKSLFVISFIEGPPNGIIAPAPKSIVVFFIQQETKKVNYSCLIHSDICLYTSLEACRNYLQNRQELPFHLKYQTYNSPNNVNLVLSHLNISSQF